MDKEYNIFRVESKHWLVSWSINESDNYDLCINLCNFITQVILSLRPSKEIFQTYLFKMNFEIRIPEVTDIM